MFHFGHHPDRSTIPGLAGLSHDFAMPGMDPLDADRSTARFRWRSAGNPVRMMHTMSDRPHRSSEPYALSGKSLAAPPLPGEAVVAATVDRLIDLVAVDLVAQAKACVRKFGDFHLALSGGSTPQPLYERLMYDPNYRMLPWRRTHLWIVDERCVPFSDDRSNFRMIRETIVDHADIPIEQVHPIFAESETADVDYERELKSALEWREKGQDRLDFILLGMGGDGHTASLFPHSAALEETDRLVAINTGGETPSPGRVTMTYPLINSARMVAVMVAGFSKFDAIQRLAHGEKETVQTLPIMGIMPVGGELKWYLDSEAAGADG